MTNGHCSSNLTTIQELSIFANLFYPNMKFKKNCVMKSLIVTICVVFLALLTGLAISYFTRKDKDHLSIVRVVRVQSIAQDKKVDEVEMTLDMRREQMLDPTSPGLFEERQQIAYARIQGTSRPDAGLVEERKLIQEKQRVEDKEAELEAKKAELKKQNEEKLQMLKKLEAEIEANKILEEKQKRKELKNKKILEQELEREREELMQQKFLDDTVKKKEKEDDGSKTREGDGEEEPRRAFQVDTDNLVKVIARTSKFFVKELDTQVGSFIDLLDVSEDVLKREGFHNEEWEGIDRMYRNILIPVRFEEKDPTFCNLAFIEKIKKLSAEDYRHFKKLTGVVIEVYRENAKKVDEFIDSCEDSGLYKILPSINTLKESTGALLKSIAKLFTNILKAQCSVYLTDEIDAFGLSLDELREKIKEKDVLIQVAKEESADLLNTQKSIYEQCLRTKKSHSSFLEYAGEQNEPNFQANELERLYAGLCCDLSGALASGIINLDEYEDISSDCSNLYKKMTSSTEESGVLPENEAPEVAALADENVLNVNNGADIGAS